MGLMGSNTGRTCGTHGPAGRPGARAAFRPRAAVANAGNGGEPGQLSFSCHLC